MRLLGWVRTGSGFEASTNLRNFIVNFADFKYSACHCFTSCYCTVVDDKNKQIGFHGNVPPSCKQRAVINTVLSVFQQRQCRISPGTWQARYRSNALDMNNSKLAEN